MGHVFISYSRKDRGFVEDLVIDLEKRKVDCWLDRHDIQGGQPWRGEIASSIRNCDAFVIVLSAGAIHSENVKRELAVAESHQRRIIPLRYQSCSLPPEMELTLSHVQWIDFVEAIYEDAFDRLVQCLQEGGSSEERGVRPWSHWWIAGFGVFLALCHLPAVVLYFVDPSDFSSDEIAWLRGIPPYVLILDAVIAILSVTTSIALVLGRRQAFYLLLASIGCQTIHSTWVFFSTDDDSIQLGAAVILGLAVYVAYGVRKLDQEFVISGDDSKGQRAPSPSDEPCSLHGGAS